jgi:hypothetical protein
MNNGQYMTPEDMRVITGLPPEYLPAVKGNDSPAAKFGQEQSPQSIHLSATEPMQRMQTKYATAIKVQKPRNLAAIVEKVLEEAACAGEDFYYRWEVKNRKTNRNSVVEGGSIGLAYCIARNWGNCVVDVELETRDGIDVFTASWIDLETGFTTSRLFRKKHNPVGGNYDAERADDMGFQVGQSKPLRNVIFAGVPKWLETKAIEVAKASEAKGLEDPTRFVYAKGKVLSFLAKYGVTEERVFAKIGKPASEWTRDEYMNVRSLATEIKDGLADPDEVFPPLTNVPADKGAPLGGEQSKKPRATTASREAAVRAAQEAGLDVAGIEKDFGVYSKDWSYVQCEQVKQMAADALAAAGVVPDPEQAPPAQGQPTETAPLEDTQPMGQAQEEAFECPDNGAMVRLSTDCAACNQKGLCPATDGQPNE